MLRALFFIALTFHAFAFAGDRAFEHLRVLSGERPIEGSRMLSNRFSEENKRMVRRYLTRVLRGYGLTATKEGFATDVPRFGGQGIKHGVNVIAEVAGSDREHEVVELVAHYDSQGPTVLGADDNASGVTALLEIARAMSHARPRRTVRFVFCDLEENGFWGSRYRAGRDVADTENKVVAAFIVDMIGYHPQGIPLQLDVEVGTVAANRALANRVLTQERRGLRLFPVTRGANPEWSDHGSYWNVGIPALLFAESVERTNPNYHSPEDRVAALNPRYFRAVTLFLLRATQFAASGDAEARDVLAKRERVRATTPGGVLSRWYDEKVRTPAGVMSHDEAQSYHGLQADLASLDSFATRERIEAIVRRWDLISADRIKERLLALIQSLTTTN